MSRYWHWILTAMRKLGSPRGSSTKEVVRLLSHDQPVDLRSASISLHRLRRSGLIRTSRGRNFMSMYSLYQAADTDNTRCEMPRKYSTSLDGKQAEGCTRNSNHEEGCSRNLDNEKECSGSSSHEEGFSRNLDNEIECSKSSSHKEECSSGSGSKSLRCYSISVQRKRRRNKKKTRNNRSKGDGRLNVAQQRGHHTYIQDWDTRCQYVQRQYKDYHRKGYRWHWQRRNRWNECVSVQGKHCQGQGKTWHKQGHNWPRRGQVHPFIRHRQPKRKCVKTYIKPGQTKHQKLGLLLKKCDEIKRRVTHDTPPTSTLVTTDRHLASVLNKNTSSCLEMKEITLEHINSLYKDFTRVYTDSSKTTGAVGIGVFSEQPRLEKALRVNGDLSNNSGEMLAVKVALETIVSHGNRINTSRKVVLFTDSLMCLQALEDQASVPARLDLVLEVGRLVDRLRQDGVDVVIAWLPGHVGLDGNEQADALAKAATEKSTVDIDVKIDFREAISEIKNEIRDILNSEK